jgi:response regulator of citrate/malate metabolism
VIFIGDPGRFSNRLHAVNGQPEFQLLDILSTPDELADIAQTKPDLILLDHQVAGQPTVDVIDDIALEFPAVAIVTILPDNDSLEIQKAMLAGARAFLVQPFTQINLLSTLRRVKELEHRRRSHSTNAKTTQVESTRLSTLWQSLAARWGGMFHRGG